MHSSIPLVEIPDPSPGAAPSSLRALTGMTFPPQQQVLLYSSDQWEDFTLEWVHSQKSKYEKVLRLTGGGDMGIDVVGLTGATGLNGVWDNFQCKHYKNALDPSTAAGEIAKILWHSFNQEFSPPRMHYFIAPRDCGMKLCKLLSEPLKLKSYVVTNWENSCSKKITSTRVVELSGAFESYVANFDFGIFSHRTTIEVLDEHRTTPYYAIRFGGGLPDRPLVLPPPNEIKANESRYVQQLFEAYGEFKRVEIASLDAVAPWSDLTNHFHRQRESFYHAESLRNFARDTVPPGTFEDLQDEIHAGVADIESTVYSDGYTRLNAVTQAATFLQLTANALITVVKIQDKKGICHQLANEDRLRWKK